MCLIEFMVVAGRVLVRAKEEFRNRTDQVMNAKWGEGDFILGIFFLAL